MTFSLCVWFGLHFSLEKIHLHFLCSLQSLLYYPQTTTPFLLVQYNDDDENEDDFSFKTCVSFQA